MAKAVKIPKNPSKNQGVFGAIFLNEPNAFNCALLPIENSDNITGIPINTIKAIYNNKNAPPPFCVVTSGKRQILPNPTAEPAAAAITPNFEPNESRFPGTPAITTFDL